jgi:carboxypeptidase Q
MSCFFTESDVGCWPAIGFGYSGSAAGMTSASTLVGALTPFVKSDHTLVLKGDGRGVDIRPLSDQGVPCFLLRLEDNWWDSAYFKYHHTEADTIDKINPLHLVQNLQCVASLAVALADDESVLDRHAPGAPFVSAPSDFVIPAHRC